MQRIVSNLALYAIAIALLGVVFAVCVFVTKSTNDLPPALVYSAGVGLYTIMILYILHRRAGTLKPTPEESRGGGDRQEDTGDEGF